MRERAGLLVMPSLQDRIIEAAGQDGAVAGGTKNHPGMGRAVRVISIHSASSWHLPIQS